jgi:spore coat polysaccharide biosynthesis protein SpsF
VSRTERVIACVAVRLASKRLPRKALADLTGRPLVQRLIERVAQAEEIDEVVLCTSTHPDDRPLLDLASACRVPALAGSEEDVLARFIQAADAFDADVIVRVTGDNPLTDPGYLDRLIRLLRDTNAEYARVHDLPLGVTGDVMLTSMLAPLHARIPEPSLSEYMMLYAFDPSVFRCAVANADEDVRRPSYSLTVDTPEDLALMQHLFDTLTDAGYGPTLRDVVAHLDRLPAVPTVDPEAPVKLPFGNTVSYAELLAMLDRRAEQARASLARQP